MLDSIGLTKEQVRGMLGSKDKDCSDTSKKKYLFVCDQRRMRRRLTKHNEFILCRYLEGYHPKTISRLLNVSEESVRSRLRKMGMFKREGKVGRPKAGSSKQYDWNGPKPVLARATLEDKVYLNQPQG